MTALALFAILVRGDIDALVTVTVLDVEVINGTLLTVVLELEFEDTLVKGSQKVVLVDRVDFELSAEVFVGLLVVGSETVEGLAKDVVVEVAGALLRDLVMDLVDEVEMITLLDVMDVVLEVLFGDDV